MRNHMMLAAQMASAGRASTRIGMVTSYDPSTYSAVVKLKPDNTLTGWLPVTSMWIGNGWGLFSPPTIGDLVEVQFQEDNMNAGFIVGRFFNDEDRPLAVESGEFWLVHKSGSFLKFTNDGNVQVNSEADLTANVAGNMTSTVAGDSTTTATNIVLNGNITLNGPVTQGAGTNGGDMQLQGPLHVVGQISSDTDVLAAGKSGAHHKHSDPQGGSVGEPT